MPEYDFYKRPLEIGLQIVRPATPKQAAGTIGCFVTSQDTRRGAYLLTAGHVLDPAKKPNAGLTATSDNKIYQPTDAHDAIGSMRWNAVCYGNVNVEGAWMGIDAGVFQLDPGVPFNNYAWRIGDIGGIAEPQVGQLVMKHGRTTGLTYGVITRINANVDTNPGSPLMNMIEVEHRTPAQVGFEGDDVPNFCEEGDSGAALINQSRQIVGIVHGRTGNFSYATRAMAIFQYMQLNFINCVAQPPK
jgi:hypothetical protein